MTSSAPGAESRATHPVKLGPFDAEFLADLPYDPSVLFFDELLEVDVERSLVRCRMPTDRPMPLVDAQRAHPVLHPRHVAGGIFVHATGMLGFVHAYHLLGLRHRDGWIGYGTNIHRVVFRKLVQPGSPIEATCVATRSRLGIKRHMIRYEFEFRHEGSVCYEGDQTAVWIRVQDVTPADSRPEAETIARSLA
ncbi:hypothetical protein [Sorangium sp. So ce131]|uniref:hypothetical protein n=1 Tax=Sorangium sp. So ce131 TaxID=3133282 RepID=UPI003F5D66C8